MRKTDAGAWAYEEFGHAEMKDLRWGRRLVQVAHRALLRPAGRVGSVFTNDAERQGAYGFLESKVVDAAEVGAAMYGAAARRSAEEDFIFCAVDGTSLTLVDRDSSKGFGPIGNRSKRSRGLKVMNAMVLSTEGVPLGLTSQQYWTRSERKRRTNRDLLRPEQKETHYWFKAMQQTREVMAAHAPATRCWFQLDREGDSWPLLTTAGADNHLFTIRSCRNRWILQADGQQVKLHDLLSKQIVITKYELEVRGTPKRQARTATMVVRVARVTLNLRDKRTGRRFPMTLNVVQAKERGTTPLGEKPIEWTLLTNKDIDTNGSVHQVIFGYSMRWRIEELHRTWKSGTCGVEETQLRSPGAVIKWATILIAVAVRIERIKQLAREQPSLAATDEFTPLEIKATVMLRFGKPGKARLKASITVAEVVLWIAQLGGYTGKSSGGPPGSMTIARGLKDVRAAAQALEALDL